MVDKILIKNGMLHTMAKDGKFVGDLLIEDKKIKALGKHIECDDAAIIDASGLCVLPGLIDAHTHIGGMDYAYFPPTNDDANEIIAASTPALKVIYGVNPDVKYFKQAYTAGITSIVITEGSGNVINGWAFATKTYGDDIFEMAIKNPCALKVALGGSPKKNHACFGREPYTRMGTAAVFRRKLLEARKYMNEKDSGKNPTFDRELEAVLPALRREIPIKIHCTQHDMMTAIDICNEFNVKFSIDHAWGATDYIDEIVAGGGYVCFGPLGSRRASGEYRKLDIGAIKQLDDRGVTVCLITDAPIFSIEDLYHYIGEAVREGVDVDRALRMVTINPAIIAGIDDRVGSLEAGKDADIAIFKGQLGIDTDAKIVYSISDGKIIYRSI